jgi:hypothetical protein
MNTFKEVWAACPRSDRIKALACLALIPVILVAAIAALHGVEAMASDDAYAYYDVECSDNGCIRYNPQNGESWILACPGAPKGCEWDPIEVREP